MSFVGLINHALLHFNVIPLFDEPRGHSYAIGQRFTYELALPHITTFYLSMPTLDEIRAIKNTFSDAVEEHASAHKVIAAAKALREVYRSLPKAEQMDLIEWVRLRSDLDTFINGENKTYYVQIAVLQKGLRRANLEHLERYSSEETAVIEGEQDAGDEYVFNIWRSEWRYIENFLKQFEISYRVVSGSLEGDVSPAATADFLS